MACFLRYFAIAAAVCVTVIAPAQDSAWRVVQPDSHAGRVVLGPDGTIYFAVVDHSASQDRIRVRAFTPTGSLKYDRLVDQFTDIKARCEVSDMDIDNGLLFIATKSTLTYGVSPVAAVIATTGATYWNWGTEGVYSISASGQHVVTACSFYSLATGETVRGLQWYTRGGAIGAFQALPEPSRDGDVLMAPGGGVAYFAGALIRDVANNRYDFMVIRAAPMGPFSYVNAYTTTAKSSQELSFVRLNPSNGKLYALGFQTENNVTDLPRHLALLEITADTGLDPVIKVITNDGSALPRGLAIDTNGSIVAAGFSFADQNTVIGRFGLGLSTSWLTTIPGAEMTSHDNPSLLAFDSQHNIFAGMDAFSNAYPVTGATAFKLNPTTGAVETYMQDHYGTGSQVQAVQVDALGNALAVAIGQTSSQAPVDTFLTRLQQAFLTLSNSAPFGGSNVTATLRMSTSAPTGGAFFALSSSDPLAVQVPGSIAVPAGNSTKAFTVQTFPRSTDKNVTISASRKGFTAQVVILVKAPALVNLAISPSTVIGGTNTAGTVTLGSKAPTGGTPVTLGASNGAASVPALVTVPAGSSSVGFTIGSQPVASDRSITITAMTPGVTRTATLLVKAPVLSGIDVSPTSVTGGTSATLTATLSGNAAVGVQVQIYSGSPGFVHVPANIWVSAGQSTKAATITTSAVTTTMPVLIFASANGVYKVTTLTLTP